MIQTVVTGKLVSYRVAVTVEKISPERLSARPDDKELLGSQVDYREERVIFDSAYMNKEFQKILKDMRVDEIRSARVTYPNYEAENIVVLPLDRIRNATSAAIAPGVVLGLDTLIDKVHINEEATELEVINVTDQNGRKFVVLDSNSQFDGMTIRFDVEVTGISVPTEEDIRLASLGR